MVTVPEVSIEFRVFGPLAAVRQRVPLDCGGHLERAVLAALLLTPGQSISVERLVGIVWGATRRPQKPAHALQTHVMRLRHHLGTNVVDTKSNGYRVAAKPNSVDAHRFDHLLLRADRALSRENLRQAEELYSQALAECGRGEPWVDLIGSSAGDGERARMNELRLSAEERRGALSLVLGQLRIGEPERLAAEQPLREARWVLLMRSQVMAGRQADALRSYTKARTLLQSELGLDPSPALRELERRVLQQDPTLDKPAWTDLIQA